METVAVHAQSILDLHVYQELIQYRKMFAQNHAVTARDTPHLVQLVMTVVNHQVMDVVQHAQ